MNRPALGSFPSNEWSETIHKGLLSVAPKGTPHLFTQVRKRSSIQTLLLAEVHLVQMCGSCANEGALKAAFMAYRARQRGEQGIKDFTSEEVRRSALSSTGTH
jgi:4-aminobutyrate aminotransferase/(S)-3-amino-2-methylpropionate transaminase